MSAEAVAESIPPGYKQTEVGVIPEDWSSICYADYLNIISGLGFKKAEYCDVGIRLLRIDNVSYGQISWDSIAYLPFQYAEKFPNLVLLEGDILLALNRPITNNQLKLASLGSEDSPAILYQRVGKINVINSKLDKRFAYFVLRKFIKIFVEDTSVGSDQPFVSTTALKKIHIPLPPTLAEQEAIATALSDTDALIESLEQLIAKKRQVKQGAMQELLTGKRRLPGFSGEWEVKCVGDVLKIAHGRNQHAVEDQNGIYPILATGGQIGTANQFLYDKPSVLIGRKGTIDKPQFMDKPFWTVDTLFYSIILEPNNAKFLYYKFCLIDWKQYNEASGVPSLNARTIEQIVLKVPSSEEQTAIATILSDMDAEITTLEEKLAKTHQIKQGMMQELLTGRIRLV